MGGIKYSNFTYYASQQFTTTTLSKVEKNIIINKKNKKSLGP